MIKLQDRNLVDSTEWRRAIEAVDEAVAEHLRDIGFDEARYGARIGFGKLKWCGMPASPPSDAHAYELALHAVPPCVDPKIPGLNREFRMHQVSGGGIAEKIPRCRSEHPHRAAAAL